MQKLKPTKTQLKTISDDKLKSQNFIRSKRRWRQIQCRVQLGGGGGGIESLMLAECSRGRHN